MDLASDGVKGGAVGPVGGGRAVIDEEPTAGTNGVFEMAHAGGGVFEPAHNVEGNHHIGRHRQRLGDQVAVVALGMGQVTPDGGEHAAGSIYDDEPVRQSQGTLHLDRFERHDRHQRNPPEGLVRVASEVADPFAHGRSPRPGGVVEEWCGQPRHATGTDDHDAGIGRTVLAQERVESLE